MSGLVLPPAVKSIGLSTLDNRKPQSLLAAAQHNRRHPGGRGWQRKSEPAKIHLNQCLQGPDTCEGVVALQEAMMASVGYAPKRKDYSQAFELLFTTPADFTVDYSMYFAWCLEWTQANLGRGIVLSADTHFDEGIDKKTPHLHILLAPIVGGAWAGNGFTSTRTWPELQAKFGRDIELTFGLKLLPQLKGKALTAAATAVTARLTELLAPHLDPDVLHALLKLARRKPAGLVGPLGITAGSGDDGGAAFKRIALSTGKGGKTERKSNPYGIGRVEVDAQSIPHGIQSDPVNHPEKPIPFLCNGVEGGTPAQTLPPATPAASTGQCFDDVDQPLTDTPNADGEVRAPAMPRTKAQTSKVANGRQTVASQSGCHLDDVTDDEQTVTTRQRDADHETGQWCPELGEFITQPPSTRKPPPRAARASVEDLVGAGLVSRGRAGAAGAVP